MLDESSSAPLRLAHRLSSLYGAMAHFALEPLLVPEGPLNGEPRQKGFPNQFYDCHADGQSALEVVLNRIKKQKDIIGDQHIMISSLREFLLGLNNSIVKGDWRGVSEDMFTVEEYLREYGRVVDQSNSYMQFPSALGNLHSIGGEYVMTNFNPERNKEGFYRELSRLVKVTNELKRGNNGERVDRLFHNSIGDPSKDYKHPPTDLLGRNLATTRNVLDREFNLALHDIAA